MATYIIAYTLKHKTIPNKFIDEYNIYMEEEGFTKKDVQKIYDELIEKDGNKRNYYLWTASISRMLVSTEAHHV